MLVVNSGVQCRKESVTSKPLSSRVHYHHMNTGLCKIVWKNEARSGGTVIPGTVCQLWLGNRFDPGLCWSAHLHRSSPSPPLQQCVQSLWAPWRQWRRWKPPQYRARFHWRQCWRFPQWRGQLQEWHPPPGRTFCWCWGVTEEDFQWHLKNKNKEEEDTRIFVNTARSAISSLARR